MTALTRLFVILLLAVVCGLGMPSRVNAEAQRQCPNGACVDGGATACGTSGCRAAAVPDHPQYPWAVTADRCPTNCDSLVQGHCPGSNCFTVSSACPTSGYVTDGAETTCTGPECAATDLPGPCLSPKCRLDPWMHACGSGGCRAVAGGPDRQGLPAIAPCPTGGCARPQSQCPNGVCLATPDACPSHGCITSAVTAECIGRNCSVDDAFGVHRFELRFTYIDAPLTLNRVLTAGCPNNCTGVVRHHCPNGNCMARLDACPNAGCIAGSVERLVEAPRRPSTSRPLDMCSEDSQQDCIKPRS